MLCLWGGVVPRRTHQAHLSIKKHRPLNDLNSLLRSLFRSEELVLLGRAWLLELRRRRMEKRVFTDDEWATWIIENDVELVGEEKEKLLALAREKNFKELNRIGAFVRSKGRYNRVTRRLRDALMVVKVGGSYRLSEQFSDYLREGARTWDRFRAGEIE